MMKKVLVILTILVAVTSFGAVSSARAFVDPVSLTVILGTVMIAVVTGGESYYHDTANTPVKIEATVDKTEVSGKMEQTDGIVAGH